VLGGSLLVMLAEGGKGYVIEGGGQVV